MNDGQNCRPILRLFVPGNAVFRSENGIVDKAIGAKKRIHEVRDHNYGHHIREADNRLNDLGNPHFADFRHHQCNRHSNHNAQQDKDHIVGNRVADHDPGILCLEKELEILKSHKRAFQNALGVVQSAKCDCQTIHWQIVVDEQVDQSWQHHQNQWEIADALGLPVLLRL